MQIDMAQYNIDESHHFVIDLDDSKTLDLVGFQSSRYRSIVSGREGITMCVLLKGGKLTNPGKKGFLELDAVCIRLVNLEKDENGDNWAEKSMIQCGLYVSCDDVWKVNKLSKELKQIIAFYPDVFGEGYSQGAMSANL
ncbi:hypothetical protein PHMEG_00032390, partial [Phytophthora megakarya]